jgi:hypothetical protein
MLESDIAIFIEANRAAEQLMKRARQWPRFRVERRVTRILSTHPDFKNGPISAVLLFKAYKLALQNKGGSTHEMGRAAVEHVDGMASMVRVASRDRR